MSDAAGRFKRLLGLLPRFAERERWSLTELADAFGVSAAEIAEDLDALAARYDDPAGFMPSVAVYLDGDAVVVRTNHFRRPMRVTVRELCALELGLALMSHQEGAGSGIPSLREQLAAAIARLPRDAAYDGLQQGALTGDDGGKWLPLLRRAVRGGRVVHLRYQGAHHGEGTLRAVRPYALVYGRGKWYLEIGRAHV